MTDGLASYRAKDVFFNGTWFGKIASSNRASKPPNGFLQWDLQI